MNYNFEWDNIKAGFNINKHKIGFNEATTVFRDPQALSVYDTDHSVSEERWLTIGISSSGKILVVCHTFVQENSNTVRIRIFSSRKANQHEIKQYQR